MKVIHQSSGLRQRRRPVCLAAGFFDGVHAGHQEVLRQTLDQARALQGEAWAMTFDPHPLKVLRPESAPLMLSDTPHKLRLLAAVGMDGCLLIRFTRRFAATPAATFLAQLERHIPLLRHIFVGADWRFGLRGEGDIAMLETWAACRGIRVHRVPAVNRGGSTVSSTRIRDAIRQGKLALATRLLGRPFSILGTVVSGNRIGRHLGYPTANLDPQNEARPPMGVYAVQAIIGRQAHPGVLNFGQRPTLAKTLAPLMELHVLDAKLNLYGRKIEVFFMKRLRAERQFADAPALIRQIGRDAAKARTALAAGPSKKLWIETLQMWQAGIIVRPKQSKERRKERE